MRESCRRRWGLSGVLVAGLGCGAAQAPPPTNLAGQPLPADVIAVQLVLPADAAALRRIAAEEEAAGVLVRRRDTVAKLNRQLLMPPPDDALAPELFDFVTAMAPRMEAGTISTPWASYLFTVYQRDLRKERPEGRPRRSPQEVEAVLDGYVEFFSIRADPRQVPPGAAAAVPADPAAEGFDALRQWRDERRLGR